MDFFNFVTERLAVGGRPRTPDDVDKLISAGITAIVSVTDEGDDTAAAAGKKVELAWFPVADDGAPKPASWFQSVIEFALPRLAYPRRKLFVHCSQGINRGPSAGYAVLRSLGVTHTAALMMIHVARPITLAGVRYATDADVAVQTLGYI